MVDITDPDHLNQIISNKNDKINDLYKEIDRLKKERDRINNEAADYIDDLYTEIKRLNEVITDMMDEEL